MKTFECIAKSGNAGKEIISKGALAAVSGTVCIPASVTKIENEYGLGVRLSLSAHLRTPMPSSMQKNIIHASSLP